MARVYVSSTFLDLVDERRAAREAILRLEHHPVGMEDYGATSQVPLEKCVEDVRKCAAYVGIFAWRYGYTPPGRKKSITQLELEAAEEADIERLIYFSPELDEWKNRHRDPDLEPIRQLRDHLRQSYTTSPFPFQSVNDLKYQIGVDLNRQINRGQRIPRLLPYLCDRQAQYLSLCTALKKAKAESFASPVLCVLHGDEYQALGKLLDSLKFKHLPRLLGRSPDSMVFEVAVRWPTSRQPGDFQQELTMLLAQETFTRIH